MKYDDIQLMRIKPVSNVYLSYVALINDWSLKVFMWQVLIQTFSSLKPETIPRLKEHSLPYYLPPSLEGE